MQHRRVAIVGASGIGRHHAKWWALEGVEVCAFAGTTGASVARTTDELRSLFGFSGRSYTDVGGMLGTEAPDIVDVCSPPHLHLDHVRLAVDAGCDVLCEKPFVYDGHLDHESLLTAAERLVSTAEVSGLRIGLCVQYVLAAVTCEQIRHACGDLSPLESVRAVLASPLRGREPDPVATWVDLGPHVLGVVQTLVPQARPAWDRVDVRVAGAGTRMTLPLVTADGRTVVCECATDRTTAEPAHVREIHLNGRPFRMKGATDADGSYACLVDSDDVSQLEPDMMRLLIREFAVGGNAFDGRAALLNLAWTLNGVRMISATRHHTP